jgi:two-component system NtrC family sensor kinase
MTIRTRLIIISVVGLAITMSLWGWIELRAFEKILVDQQITRLTDVADTVSTYYHYFPSRQGLSALDQALKDIVNNDIRLARIDLFTINREKGNIDFIAGAGRVRFDWPEKAVVGAAKKTDPQNINITTESGPALGLLYPILSDNKKVAQVLIGVIVFTQFQTDVMAKAQRLLILSTAALLIVILLFLAVSFRWLIGRPLDVIINTIDDFRKGQYVKRTSLTRADEWGHLADHFNSMADEIEQVLAKNEELNRHLSERVQEETLKVVSLQTQVNQLQKLTALGYLTATMAHDLGTPLHSIAGLAKLLLERNDLPPDVSRKLELIVEQTQRLNTVIQNVRRATRLPEPHIEATSVSDLLNETLSLVEPLMQNTNIDIDMKVEANIGFFYVDHYRIQTALFNLIQNAIEAMPEGGRIILSACTVPERHSIAISIQDSGAGMSAELLDRVCEPFFTTHTNEGLRGLGLAIVQDIVKAHGGHFEITSTPHEGTKVILYFQIVENMMKEETK